MEWTVVDLFSGGGGASYGFHAHPRFKLVGAADAQLGKPSTKRGTLDCNRTYETNVGIKPQEVDLGVVAPSALREAMGISEDPTVLIACPPCTGFSRTLSQNHLRDDARNSLVGRTALFVREFKPRILIMENARELMMGRFDMHLKTLKEELELQGYRVHSSIHMLNRFGLPQKRERTLVIAVKGDLPLLTMDDLWEGRSVHPAATTVRRAIAKLPPIEQGSSHPDDPMHTSPGIRDRTVMGRLQATPADGGSWFDIQDHSLLTPTMIDRLKRNALGSHPDVYGRMWWDRPAPTIKRESSHVGNGRYSHPEQHRLCSVRELAILNGFPRDYRFDGTLNNMYRHIGDAVPPLISYQLAALAAWILTGERSGPADLVLPGTHLQAMDIIEDKLSS